MAKKTYNFYQDPGHGWAKVSKKELIQLGITSKISSFSFERGEYVYLEEDSDLSTFIKEKMEIDNLRIEDFKWNEFNSNKTSKIRNYNCYTGV